MLVYDLLNYAGMTYREFFVSKIAMFSQFSIYITKYISVLLHYLIYLYVTKHMFVLLYILYYYLLTYYEIHIIAK